jgi:ABC-2 type transport system permease protein
MYTFWALVRKSVQKQITYRAATTAGFVTNLFFGFIRAAILIALYGQQTEVAGVSVQKAITYAALSQAVIGYLSLFRWFEIIQSVQSGQIATELTKPIGYFTYWLSQDLGRALVQLVLRGILFMPVFHLFFPLYWPTTLGQWLAIGAALALSWLVSFSWRFLINLPAFWTPNALGIGRFLLILAWFFSGFMMALRFFPDWVTRLANLTPFPAMVNTVVEIYLGLLTGPEILAALASQLFWAVALIVTSQLVLRLGIKRLVIQGG